MFLIIWLSQIVFCEPQIGNPTIEIPLSQPNLTDRTIAIILFLFSMLIWLYGPYYILYLFSGAVKSADISLLSRLFEFPSIANNKISPAKIKELFKRLENLTLEQSKELDNLLNSFSYENELTPVQVEQIMVLLVKFGIFY